ncbi:unnamed protein product [Dibothriocephalus latus]|uniref:Uncharacterized protein n=1 Tax=Dibothriocephalus latus TaxID=60516 RepID=A0A3P7LLF1_DIBLA|nr:unnamed protein product [Dibothriocephalus latus]
MLKNREYVNGAAAIRLSIADVERKWQTLVALCGQHATNFDSLLKHMADCDSRYRDLDVKLAQNSRLVEALGSIATTPVLTAGQIQQVKILKDAVQSLQPDVAALERATDDLLRAFPPFTDLSDYKNRAMDVRERYDRLTSVLSTRASLLRDVEGPGADLHTRLQTLSNELHDLGQTFNRLPTNPTPDELREYKRKLDVCRSQFDEAIQLGDRICQEVKDPAAHSDIRRSLGERRRSLLDLEARLEERLRTAGVAVSDKGARESTDNTLTSGPIPSTATIPGRSAQLDPSRTDLLYSDKIGLNTSYRPIPAGQSYSQVEKQSFASPRDPRTQLLDTLQAGTQLEQMRPGLKPPSESERKAFDEVEQQVQKLQAWVDLERSASHAPIAKSGAFPLSKSALSPLIQSLRTEMDLVDVRKNEAEKLLNTLERQLISASSASMTKGAELQARLQRAVSQLDQIRTLNNEKRWAALGGGTSALPPQPGSRNQLNQLIDDVSQQLRKLEEPKSTLLQSLDGLETSLREAGDSLFQDSMAPLRQKELEGVENQLALLGSTQTIVDPDSLTDRLEDIGQVRNQLTELENKLNSWNADIANLKDGSTAQLDKTASDLMALCSRLQRQAELSAAELEARIEAARKFATRMEILKNNIAAAQKACPLRPNK